MAKKLLLLPGDGIGQEITEVSLKLLDRLIDKYSLDLEVVSRSIGGEAYDKYGTPLPKDVLAEALNSDAVLLGAVGGYKWDQLPFESRPERALLALRKELALYSNVRPIEILPELIDNSPLKPEYIKGVDLVIIRELTGDLYFGEPRGITKVKGVRQGVNTMVYSEDEIIRIAEFGFKQALTRSKKLCSVDKANVLETSMLWREVVEDVAKKYPQVELSHLYVDNAAMQLIRNPKQFDVIVTSNMFGDILSDLSAMLPGSIGLLASASFGKKHALFEPIHGSAPDIAGQNKANPLASLICVSYLIEFLFNNHKLATQIKEAVANALTQGRTQDLAIRELPTLTCSEMGELVIKQF